MSDKLQEIKQRWKDAPNGPWKWINDSCLMPANYSDYGDYILFIQKMGIGSEYYADLIAKTPTDIAWLIEQLEQERKQKENCIQAYNDMETLYDNLKIANDALQSQLSGKYIAWINGEENHLESLSCNVMIHADDLRSLVNEQLAQASQENAELRSETKSWKILAENGTKLAGVWRHDYSVSNFNNQKLIEALADIESQTMDEESQYIAAKTLQEVQHGTSKEN